MPKPSQDTQGATKPSSLSVDEAVARLSKAKGSAAAPPPEQQPDGIDPEGTTLENEESDAGGSDGADADDLAAAGDLSDDDQDAKDLFTVTVNGEEVEVSLDDLIASYSRHGDYTKKTQALAEQRRAIEQQAKEFETGLASLSAEKQKLAKQAEQYDAALQAVQSALKTADDEWVQVDWEKWFDEDPHEAQKSWVKYQQHKERKAAADAEAKRREDERAEEARQRQAEAHKAFLTEVAKSFPEWSDEQIRTKDLAAMHKAARDLGFTDAEYRSTTDARILKMLHKAMQLDRIKAVKAGATNQAPNRVAGRTEGREPALVVQPSGARPVVRAGAGGKATVRDALQTFRQTKSIDAAAGLLAARRAEMARGATRRR
jgi:hypothetical protein